MTAANPDSEYLERILKLDPCGDSTAILAARRAYLHRRGSGKPESSSFRPAAVRTVETGGDSFEAIWREAGQRQFHVAMGEFLPSSTNSRETSQRFTWYWLVPLLIVLGQLGRLLRFLAS